MNLRAENKKEEQIHHSEFAVQQYLLEFETRGCMEFMDFTEECESVLQHSGIRRGLMNIQSKHTTAAIVVNENEPLLLQDMKQMLERIAPQGLNYQHNDFSIRTVNMQDQEDRNGHSHCKAIFLPTSQIMNVTDGKLDLGKWQRIFLLELDQRKKRSISITILGL